MGGKVINYRYYRQAAKQCRLYIYGSQFMRISEANEIRVT
jgi:hypothetical protein